MVLYVQEWPALQDIELPAHQWKTCCQVMAHHCSDLVLACMPLPLPITHCTVWCKMAKNSILAKQMSDH